MADDKNTPCLVADVIIDQKIPLVLSYHIPDELAEKINLGARCEVPFRDKILKGFVVGIKNQTPTLSLKSLIALSDSLFISAKLLELAQWMSKYYVTPLPKVLHFFIPRIIKSSPLETVLTHGVFNSESKETILEFLKTHHPRKKKALEFILKAFESDQSFLLSDIKKKLSKELFESFQERSFIKGIKKSSLMELDALPSVKKILTSQQAKIASDLKDALIKDRASMHLLYGVCGSGKTEVYFEVMEQALQMGLGIIYMVPEVALAPQTINRLKKRFNVKIALIHHQVSDGIKKQDFQDLQSGVITLAVGARSCIFAPIKNLGLIIIDEEHENAYKQEGMPTYHAKDVAIMRARLEGAMVILGSATPSIETYYHALSGKLKLHKLTQRPSFANLPTIHLAPLGTDFQKAQGLGLFSEEGPLKALQDNFNKGEQSLIFINRRGYHALMQCSSCAKAIKCQNCSIAMTFHKKETKLVCHFCGFEQTPPQVCPLCAHETMQFKGVGTQLVEARLQKALPQSRILRIDKDTTNQKGSLDNYFATFSDQGADILVGTQMIAKGLDFSGLTLAIVLNIDGAFNRPDFRAHEEAFQLMTQVAGRVGRSTLPGQVYIQSFNPDHSLCLKAKHGDYESFYHEEIKERELYNFPPFARLVRFVFSDTDFKRLDMYAQNFRKLLLQNLPSGYSIEPLLPCFHEKIENHFRYHFMIKGVIAVKLYQIIDTIDQNLKMPSSLKRLIDVDPRSTYF